MQNVTQLYSYMVSDLRVRQPWAFEAAVADSCDGGTWAVQAAQGNNTPRRPPRRPKTPVGIPLQTQLQPCIELQQVLYQLIASSYAVLAW